MSDTPNLATALVAALADLEDLPRTRTAKVETKAGGTYSYSYADLADSLKYVRPVLSKHNLAVYQDAHTVGQDVAVATTIIHESGECLRTEDLVLPSGSTPQAAGSAITYARRYQLLAVLGLATEDDDGAAATRDAKARQERPAEPPRSEQQMSHLREVRSTLAELNEDDEERQAGREIWSSVTGRAGQYPTTYAQASELLTRLAEAGIYVPGGEPFDDPNDDEGATA